jgi:hypothetical protein
MELVMLLDEHYSKGAEAFSIKVAVAHVHQWFQMIDWRVQQQKDCE